MIDRTPAVETGAERRRAPAAFAALEHPQYRWLYASNQLFFLAMQAQQVVRSWLAFELTRSELALGYVSFAVALPMLITAPVGGALGDRVERRGLILAGQGAILVSEFVMLGLLLGGALEFWHLLTATFLMGCVFPFIMPARQAIVVNIVGKRGLANAMALSMAGINATRVIGPLVAGALIGPFGVEVAYALGVAVYVAAWLLLLPVKPTYPQAPLQRSSIAADIAEGGRYLGRHRVVLALLIFGLVPMFLAMPFQTLLVVFAEDIWHTGASGFGLLSAAAGVGGVVGSVYMAHHAERGDRLGLMLRSMLAFGGVLFLFALSPWFLAALPLVLVATAYSSIFTTVNNAAIQLLIPDRVRGRVSSFLMMSFSLPMLGTLPLSALAEWKGAPLAVATAAVLATLAALAYYLLSPSLRSVDQSVLDAMHDDGAEGPLQAALLK
jgi:MFS family permease